MQKFISTKEVYANFKKVSDEVQNGTTFVVLKHSKPAYKIAPLVESTAINANWKKKYTLKDIHKFTFKSKNPETNLATTFKKYLYS